MERERDRSEADKGVSKQMCFALERDVEREGDRSGREKGDEQGAIRDEYRLCLKKRNAHVEGGTIPLWSLAFERDMERGRDR